MSSWAPDTRRLGIGDITTRVYTNSLLRREGGVTFAKKNGRGFSFSRCLDCDATIRFDGIVWLSAQDDRTGWAKPYVCRVASRRTDLRQPHRPRDLAEKAIARRKVFDLLRREFDSRPLSLLSLPGIDWELESQLLDRRERPHTWPKNYESQTTIYGVESVDVIYRAGCLRMPGAADGISVVEPPDFASYALTTRKVAAYFRGDVFSVLRHLTVDAAWLDLTGPLSSKQLTVIAAAWSSGALRRCLVVTSLRGRWAKSFADEVAAQGGLTQVLEHRLATAAADTCEYADPAPMHQVAFIRDASAAPEEGS